MQIQSYNEELAIANLMFIRLFNNIRIFRTENNGTVNDIKVQCTFGQRSRILKAYQNPERRGEMRLPMITVNRTGYARSPQRVNNLHNEVKFELTSKYRKYDLLTPVPIDISYDVSVIAKYPSDIDKIASNFMVFFNNDVYVSCEHPKYEGIMLNNQVVMQDSVSEEHPDEIDGSTDDLITATFQFTFKTYLFGGMQKAKKKRTDVISTSTYTALSDVVSSLTYDQLTSNAKELSDKMLSVYVQQEVTSTISTVISTDTEDDVYEGFVPIVQQIDFGFYAVPQQSGFTEHMDRVDAMENLSDMSTHVDRISWTIDETNKYTGLSNIAYIRTEYDKYNISNYLSGVNVS